MHNESPIIAARAEPRSADSVSSGQAQPTSGRLHQSDSQSHGIEQQRQRAKRTALWVGAIAVLVYVGFILSGVIGR
ncbi:hypothetical protein ACQ5SA_10950 [Stenotrophomonas indicatrix]|uniref:hypothetical protein n=1 Tax=Stenotrophomonas lactitubi TaxID=2045214 RepID=UPI001DD470B0|nr:hypothetical protein [Stenotrophomonas lactitubi]CAH0252295.1 hypothetical protein SRABI35_02986 [Stenotrophomonas lactitubi]